MRKKGFTLIELLVVIAIIAMLLAILMPALNKVKKIAQRVVCGTNLKGLGTAQVVYANDYEDAFVVQGGGGQHPWVDAVPGWQAAGKNWGNPGNDGVTIGASLYLLVREADVSPKSFVCPSSSESAYDGENTVGADITELWDFGSILATGIIPAGRHGPRNHVSYSYHMPYGNPGGAGRFAADGTRSAAFAVMADKNLWYDGKLLPTLDISPQNFREQVRQMPPWWDTTRSIQKWTIQAANSQPHSREGQNVSFGDGHSAYEKTADVGVRHDNIYTIRLGSGATEDDVRRGRYTPPYAHENTEQPQGGEDSFLVNDDYLGVRP